MKNINNKQNDSRYKYTYVGSDFAILPWKDYDIIDIKEGRVVESHNSPFLVKLRLKILNNEN